MTRNNNFYFLRIISLFLFYFCFRVHAEQNGCKFCETSLKNWGGNVMFTPKKIVFPQNNNDVVDIVKNCQGTIRVIGSRHSFSQIANTNETLVSLVGMGRIVGYDLSVPSITIQAGLTYSDLVTLLDSHGLALPNLADLSGITVAGATATGAHGSGINNTNLAGPIIGMSVILANGSLARWTRIEHPELMKAAAISLGAFGVVTELTLELVPAYKMETNVFQSMSITNFLANLNQIMSDAYSVIVWMDFSQPEQIYQVWLISKLGDENYKNFTGVDNYFGASKLTELVLPLLDQAPGRVSPLGVPDAWYRHLLSYGLDHGGFNGAGTSSEYFVPLSTAAKAIKAILPLAGELANLSLGVEFRVTASDDLWMSTANGENLGGEPLFCLDFDWTNEEQAVLPMISKIENALAAFKPRPHWGKEFTIEPSAYLPLYRRLDSFKRIANELDPNGKFRNSFMNEKIFAEF